MKDNIKSVILEGLELLSEQTQKEVTEKQGKMDGTQTHEEHDILYADYRKSADKLEEITNVQNRIHLIWKD